MSRPGATLRAVGRARAGVAALGCMWLVGCGSGPGPSGTAQSAAAASAPAVAVSPTAASAPAVAVSPTAASSPTSALPTSSGAPAGASTGPTIAPGSLVGRLVFTRAGGQYQDETLFTANADGTNERQITQPGSTCCPRWSPDGRELVIPTMAPDGRITSGFIRPDGSNPRALPLPKGTLNLGPGPLSPNGVQILGQGWDDSNQRVGGLYLFRASDGGGPVRVTHDADDRPADFSPDGKQVYFFRPVPGFPSIGDQPDGSMFVVAADGTNVRRVTPADLPVETPGNSGARLSRDGKWLVFTSAGVIYKIRPDGSGLSKVFSDSGGRLAITPTWSPDGAYILFGLDPPGSLAVVSDPPVNGLYVVRADGTGLTPIITTADWKRNPDWTTGG